MRKAKKVKTSGGSGGDGVGSIHPTDTFVGVQLDGVGHVVRVHAE